MSFLRWAGIGMLCMLVGAGSVVGQECEGGGGSVGTVTLDLGGSDGFVVVSGDTTRYSHGQSFDRAAGTRIWYTAYDSAGKIASAVRYYTVQEGQQTLEVGYCQMGVEAPEGAKVKLVQTGEVLTDGQTKWVPLGAKVYYIVTDAAGKVRTPQDQWVADCTPLAVAEEEDVCEVEIDTGSSGGVVKLVDTGEVLTDGQVKVAPVGSRLFFIPYDATGKIAGPQQVKVVDCTPLVAEYCEMEVEAEASGMVVKISQSGEVLGDGQSKWVPVGAKVFYIPYDETGKIVGQQQVKVADCTPLVLEAGGGASDVYCEMLVELGIGVGWLKVSQTGQVVTDGETMVVPLGAKVFYYAYDTAGNRLGSQEAKVVDCTPLLVRIPGNALAWGYNYHGQLGDNTTTDRYTPIQVLGPGGSGYLTDVVAIAAGYGHSLALKKDGTVWAWGLNDSGQLGDNTNVSKKTPVQVVGPGGSGYLTDVIAIAAGGWHSLALKKDGTVWAWGNNNAGQLGDNTTTHKYTPVQVVGPGGSGYLTDVIAIAAGGWHSLALKKDGTVWAWGANFYGQLGDNTTTHRYTPVQVLGIGGSGSLTNGIAIAGGGYHTLAIRKP